MSLRSAPHPKSVVLVGLGLLALGAIAWLVWRDHEADRATAPPDASGHEPVPTSATALPSLAGRGRSSAGTPSLGTGGSVAGVVLGEAEAPLAGVEVRILRMPPRPDFGSEVGARLDRTFLPPPPESVARTRTDEAGGFAVDGLTPMARHRAIAQPPLPYAEIWADFEPREDKTTRLRLVARRGAGFRGRVVDERGQGLAGYVSAWGWEHSVEYEFALSERATGPDGRFAVSALPDGVGYFTVRVPDRGTRAGIRVVTPTAEEVRLAIASQPAAIVAGCVTDTGGRPVGGARIGVEVRREEAPNFVWEGAGVARSDSHGTYRVAGLAPGTLDGVAADAPGFCPVGALYSGLELRAGETLGAQVILLRPAALEGTVRRLDGEPISGAIVLVASGDEHRAATDAGGHYRFTDLPPMQPGRLWCYAEGWHLPAADPQRSNRPEPYRRFRTPGESEIATLDLTLVRGFQVRGRVLDSAGKAVADARVVAQCARIRKRRRLDLPGFEVDTGRDGTFVLHGLPAADDWTIEARDPGDPPRQSAAHQLVLPPPSETEPFVELVLHPMATIGGRVVDRAGRPRERVRVWLRGRPRSVRTDFQGRFRFGGLPAGPVTVCRAYGSGEAESEFCRTRTLDWGEIADDIEFVHDPSLEIRGVVIDEAGRPARNVTVRARRMGDRGAAESAQTDVRGSFRLRGLPPGEHILTVADEAQPDPVPAGTEGLRYQVRVPPTWALEGRVLDPEGRPVPRAELTAWVGGWGSSTRVTHGLFRVRFRAFEPRVDVVVGDATNTLGEPLDVREHREERVDASAGPVEIRLRAGRAVSGQVLDPDGHGVSGIRVRVSWRGRDPRGGSEDREGFTAADGTFRVGGLEEGQVVTVRIEAPAPWVDPPSRKVPAGTAHVDYRLVRGGVLAGRVVSAEGAPVHGAQVTATWMAPPPPARSRSWSSERSLTAPDGSFRLEGVGQGPLRLRVAAGDRGSRPWDYLPHDETVSAAGREDLVLRLRDAARISGTVRSFDGKPAPRARIAVEAGGRSVCPLQTAGLDGAFLIWGLEPGPYELSVRKGPGSSGPSAVRAVRAPAEDVVLVLPRTWTLHGRVLGERPGHRRVVFLAPGSPGHQIHGSSDAAGHFALELPTPEAGLLFVYGYGDSRCASVERARSGGSPYAVRLEEGQVIEGRIVGFDDESAHRSAGLLATEDRGLSFSGTVHPDGRFIIRGLPPGTFLLRAWLQPSPEAVFMLEADDVAAGTKGVVLQRR